MKPSQPRIDIYPYWNTDFNLVNELEAGHKNTLIEDSMLGLK